jgi:hypothetical protein
MDHARVSAVFPICSAGEKNTFECIGDTIQRQGRPMSRRSISKKLKRLVKKMTEKATRFIEARKVTEVQEEEEAENRESGYPNSPFPISNRCRSAA